MDNILVDTLIVAFVACFCGFWAGTWIEQMKAYRAWREWSAAMEKQRQVFRDRPQRRKV
jgi:membrane protein DedA with SNARE-associated domain